MVPNREGRPVLSPPRPAERGAAAQGGEHVAVHDVEVRQLAALLVAEGGLDQGSAGAPASSHSVLL